MKAIELFERYYPELTEKIRSVFPAFLETAGEVEVIAWREEFQVADYNPELIEEVEFWTTLYRSGLITKEEWERRVNVRTYASKTMGVAFIDAKEVSFREEVPSKTVLVHEVGHVHFREVDSFWSSAYGGGEILFWLGVEGRVSITEEGIRRFMGLFRKTCEGKHLEVAQEIVERIAPLYGDEIVPNFYTICLYAGWIPENAMSFGIDPFDLKNPNWTKVKPFKEDVAMFFPNLTSGLQHQDPFWTEYARRLEITK